MCLMVADMLEFVPVNKDLRLTAGTGHKLRLAYSPSMGLYLGVYLHAPKRGQVWNRLDTCQVTLCVLTWSNSYRLTESLFSSSHQPLDVSCIVSTHKKTMLPLFVLICELKDLKGKFRMKGSREFKGTWKESEVKVAQWCPTLCNPMDYIVQGIL